MSPAAAGRGAGGGGIRKGGQGGRAAKPGSHRKGAAVGSGGNRRRGLEGKGPTPKAEERKGHPAARKAAAAAKRAPSRPTSRRDDDAPELLVGRNPVVEALRAKVPASALYVALGVDADERVNEAVAMASRRGLSLLEVSRQELDRMTAKAVHQGIALQVPPYVYADPNDLVERAAESASPLLVALDGVTDPRNLGAVVRSAAAFGAQGVVVPGRRSAGITAVAWRTSAGAAARLPVARATNLVRWLQAAKDAGMFVVGLDAAGSTSLDDLELATSPLVIVVGGEGAGLSRLAASSCDVLLRIPMSGGTESLNASVAASVVLAEVARRRRLDSGA